MLCWKSESRPAAATETFHGLLQFGIFNEPPPRLWDKAAGHQAAALPWLERKRTICHCRCMYFQCCGLRLISHYAAWPTDPSCWGQALDGHRFARQGRFVADGRPAQQKQVTGHLSGCRAGADLGLWDHAQPRTGPGSTLTMSPGTSSLASTCSDLFGLLQSARLFLPDFQASTT